MKRVMILMLIFLTLCAEFVFTQDYERCSFCNGTGRVSSRIPDSGGRYRNDTCGSCNGTGRVRRINTNTNPTTFTREQLDIIMQNPETIQMLRTNQSYRELIMGMLTPDLQRVFLEGLGLEFHEFEMNGTRLVKYNGSDTNITIPEGVTSIGRRAFEKNGRLRSITIPSSVTSIGEGAFYECYNLSSITIPSSVTYIGEWAFYYCWSLTSITIPSSVTYIGSSAFYKCSRLTNITIPSSVSTIGAAAFRDCTSLTSVTISRRTTIGDGAFPYSARITYSD